MADTDMTTEEREAFLADVHVGVLAIAREAAGPHALPIWYVYDGAEVLMAVEPTSVKARLLARTGRATLTVQQEALPYRYVSVEGPVVVEPTRDGDGYDLAAVATRYLGAEMGAEYAETNAGLDMVTVRLRPERWFTVDYGKTGL
jgi:PPOX class probable F420-dependent enzyme